MNIVPLLKRTYDFVAEHVTIESSNAAVAESLITLAIDIFTIVEFAI